MCWIYVTANIAYVGAPIARPFLCNTVARIKNKCYLNCFRICIISFCSFPSISELLFSTVDIVFTVSNSGILLTGYITSVAVNPCNLIVHRRFGAAYYRHVRGQKPSN
jgi:hypothetical protein